MRRFLVCTLMLLAAVPLNAQQKDDSAAQRPKIGLVLSGGGARGAAHVGVLKVLEEMRVPVDYIAGTSMGSIVGGLYASGMTPAEIETAIATMDWGHIFSDSPPREDRSFRRKRDDDLYLVKAKAGVSDQGELKFPSGAIQGQKFDLALRELTLAATGETQFDRLPIPYRAVASDIGSGKSVVLGSGDLATAMRASMAVPGIFAATRIDGTLLVDGGITNNLPINVVREMGADIVIAVDIGTPNAKPEELTNLFAITAQLTSIMTRNNVEAQIATLTDRDVLIVPDLKGFSSTDFEHATRVIMPGRWGAEAKAPQLGKFSLSEQAYQAHLAGRNARPSREIPVIRFVQINSDAAISDELIRKRLRQQLGAPLDRAQLEADIGNIYGLELFETVHYDLIEKEGETGLQVTARARSWGPDYLQFGVELASDMEGDNRFNLGVSYLRTAINPLGGEIRLAVQLGEEPRIGAEWHQPLDALSRYFVASQVAYGAGNIGIFDGRGDDRLAEYRVTEGRIDLAAGREFGVFGEFRLGYRYRTGEVDLTTGSPGWPEFHYDSGEIYGRLSLDRLDNYNFPENGWLASLEYNVARDRFGGDDDFDQVKLRANKFTMVGDGHVIGVGTMVSATLDGEAPIQDRYRLGGFLNLSGYVNDSLSGQQAGVAALTYYRHFKTMSFLSWYIGASLEYGGVWEEKSDLFDDGISSGSVFLGADSPLGPLYIGYGHAESGFNSVFFYLGRPPFGL